MILRFGDLHHGFIKFLKLVRTISNNIQLSDHFHDRKPPPRKNRGNRRCSIFALSMSFSANQAFIRLNQDLLALLATQPNVQASVDCFTLSSRRSSISAPVSRNSSTASPSRTEEQTTIHASSQHFPTLSSVLAMAFPDFDFSDVTPWDFKLVPAVEQVQASIYWAFQTHLPDSESLLPRLWQSLEKKIRPASCSIYIYESDRPDAFSASGATFVMNVFFVNERADRVVLVHLREGGSGFEEDDELCECAVARYGHSVF
jgi:hypothetical protein